MRLSGAFSMKQYFIPDLSKKGCLWYNVDRHYTSAEAQKAVGLFQCAECTSPEGYHNVLQLWYTNRKRSPKPRNPKDLEAAWLGRKVRKAWDYGIDNETSYRIDTRVKIGRNSRYGTKKRLEQIR